MADIEFYRAGMSLIVLTPASTAGRAWVDEHVQVEDWQRFGRGIACETRYARDIAVAACADGLVCE